MKPGALTSPPARLALLAVHVVLLVLLYLHFGINTGNEGDKYYTDATALVQGDAVRAFDHQHLYAVYILYLSLFVKLGASVYVIVGCTYLLGVCACWLFYKLLLRYSTPLIATVWLWCMACSPLLQYWTLSLFSELFYMALSLLFLYALLYSERARILWPLLLSLLLLFTRPSGCFTVLVGWGLWCVKYRGWSFRQVVWCAIPLLLIIGVAVMCLLPLHYKGYVVDLSRGAVYAGFPQYPKGLEPSGNYTLWDCYRYLIEQHGWWQTFVLIFKKMASFFVLWRPYYSLSHNLMNGLHVVFYALGIYGAWQARNSQSAAKVMVAGSVAVIILNVLLIGLYFNEWSERYTVTVFPFIFVCAAWGLQALGHPKSKPLAV